MASGQPCASLVSKGAGVRLSRSRSAMAAPLAVASSGKDFPELLRSTFLANGEGLALPGLLVVPADGHAVLPVALLPLPVVTVRVGAANGKRWQFSAEMGEVGGVAFAALADRVECDGGQSRRDF